MNELKAVWKRQNKGSVNLRKQQQKLPNLNKEETDQKGKCTSSENCGPIPEALMPMGLNSLKDRKTVGLKVFTEIVIENFCILTRTWEM